MKRVSIIVLCLLAFANVVMSQSFVELVEKKIEQKDYEGAIELSDAIIKSDYKCSDAYFMAAYAYLLLEQYDVALKYVNYAIMYYKKKKSSYDISVLYYLKGYIHNSLGDYDNAEASYKKAIKKNPQEIELYREIASFYDSYEKYELALANISQAIYMAPDDKELLADAAKYKAHFALSKSQHRQFIDNVVEYISLTYDCNPDMVNAAQQVDFDYLIAALSQQVEKSDDPIFWTMLRMSFYLDHEIYDKAILDLAVLEKYHPENIDIRNVWLEMARSHYYTSQYPEAIRYSTMLIDSTRSEENEDRAWGYFYRAEAYMENGELQKSIADWDTVLALSDRMSYFAYYKRGWAKEKIHDNDGAFNDYCAGIEKDGNYAYLYLMRGEQYLVHRHDTVRANEDFKRILELEAEPEDGSCRHYALLFLGYRDEAFRWLQKLIELNPDDASTYYDGACLSARAGELENSVKYLEMALQRGFRRFKHIEQDDDLDPIRNRNDFKALMKRYEGN